MTLRALPLSWLILGALTTGCAGCASQSTYGIAEGAPASPGQAEIVTRRLTVQSRPRGAMISVNGTSVSDAPAQVEIKVDPSGHLLNPVDLAADYSVSNPVRGVLNVVTITLRRGEIPPREILLARPADGGIQRTGTVPP